MLLRRVLSQSKALPTSLRTGCATNSISTEVEPAPRDEVGHEQNEEEKEVERMNKKIKGSGLESYRTNSILPNYAFLFPARPKQLEKKLYLRSLRRANYSSALSSALSEVGTSSSDVESFLTVEKEDSRRCLWCHSEAQSEDKFFCRTCHRVLPVDENIDFFYLFDMDPTFDVQISELEKFYRKHQMLLHPDKFASKDEEEQELASKQATLINKAYQKLKNPLDRAKYLLKLKGFVFDKDQTISDIDFLSEMMELQETVCEMQSKEELTALLNQVDIRRQGLHNSLGTAFKLNNLDMASELVTELSYLERVRVQIIQKM